MQYHENKNYIFCLKHHKQQINPLVRGESHEAGEVSSLQRFELIRLVFTPALFNLVQSDPDLLSPLVQVWTQ